MEDELLILFSDLDENGFFRDRMSGPRILPDRTYDCFFMVEPEVEANLHLYKVVMDGLKHKIVPREEWELDDYQTEPPTEETPTETPEEPTN
ncbi:hypothetical protein ABEW81_11335 [Priestia megaterium]